jgi:hypothetical protein
MSDLGVDERRKVFELEMAGAYLPIHYNGLKGNEVERISSTKEISELAEKGDELALALLNYSSSFTAAVISGCIEYFVVIRWTL